MRVIQGNVVVQDDELNRPSPANPDAYIQLNYWQARVEYIRQLVTKMPRTRERQDLNVKLDIAKAKRNYYLSKTRTK